MNTRRGKAKFTNFCIILDSGFSSTTVMGRLMKKLGPEKDALMQWNTQAGNITTNLKVKIYFILLTLSATNFGTWDFNVDNCSKSRCDMILGQYI